jgi:subtilisin
MERIRLRNILRSARMFVGLALVGLAVSAHGASETADVVSQDVKKSIAAGGRARVVVKLREAEPLAAGRQMDADREQQRRLDISTRQQRIRALLRGANHDVRREFRSLPYVVLEVDAQALTRLQKATGDVAQIVEDRLFEPSLANSIPQIEADIAHAHGYNGAGSVIAIIDTGIDNSHPFLAGKVVDEACFADREVPNDPGSCPNGSNEQVGTGAGAPCLFAPSTCQHGTHVAGIAAGAGDVPGVAPSANLLAVQVFHRSRQCNAFEESPCARAFSSDIAAALEYVYERRTQHEIASVNMSLGSGLSSTSCDALVPDISDVINSLKAARIATVVASGNSSSRSAISFPACISAAIAVGAVDDDDHVASFSKRLAGYGPARSRRQHPVFGTGRRLREFQRHVHGDAARCRRVGCPAPGEPARHRGCGARLPHRYGEANTRRAQWRYCHQAEDTTGCSARHRVASTGRALNLAIFNDRMDARRHDYD